MINSSSIPPDDGRGTYTGRQLRSDTVTKRERWENDGRVFHSISGGGWTCGVSPEVHDLLPEGKEFIQETIGSTVPRWLIDGRWYDRRTDEDLAEEAEKWRAEFEQRKRDRLDACRDEWQQTQDALPDWIRVRLEYFHERGGERFVLVVSGSRYANGRDRFIINEVLDRLLDVHPGLRLVHGGAQGADSLAGEWAAARGVPVEVFRADWRKHGKAAGPIRNQAMLDAGCDGWAAFPVAGEPNRGTGDFVSRASRSGVHGSVYELPPRS